jgi:2-(1,2-epoxy-1,2-dihydrophenyl)acetyl-CoA isomerase
VPDLSSDAPHDGCRLVRMAGVAVVTIDNARRRNCLSTSVMDDLRRLLAEVGADGTCGAVVLTGAEGYFCAGADTRAMANLTTHGAVQRLEAGQAVVQSIATLPIPVVAAIEGGAAGGGISIAAACDLVVVASDARLVLAFGRLGLAPDLGALHCFERRMGLSATRRLAYLASSIEASEAVELGLMDVLVEPGAARDHALDIASAIAARSRTANSVVKEALLDPSPSLIAALRAEVDRAPELYESSEYRQATSPAG